MKILVTGSSGFIGTHLMKALGKVQIEAIPFDIKRDWEENITDYGWVLGILRQSKIDYIIHLAAISSLKQVEEDPRKAIITNITGTYNVLQAAKKCGVKRVIVTSSAAIYEPDTSIYAMTKLATETLAKHFDNAIIARLFNVYGKGSKSVVNKFIKRIKNGDPVRLNGNTIRDYVYIDDVVSLLIELLSLENSAKIYEIGTCRGTSLKQLIKIISKTTKKNFVATLLDPIEEIQESVCKSDPNWFLPTSLEEGIKKLI